MQESSKHIHKNQIILIELFFQQTFIILYSESASVKIYDSMTQHMVKQSIFLSVWITGNEAHFLLSNPMTKVYLALLWLNFYVEKLVLVITMVTFNTNRISTFSSN